MNFSHLSSKDYVNVGGLEIDGCVAVIGLCLLVALITIVSLWTGQDKDGE